MLKARLAKALIGLIVLTTAVKLCLMGSGLFENPDETRYASSVNALKYFTHLKIGLAVNAIFSTQARPGDVLVRIIPCALQFATQHIFKLHYYEPANSYPVFIINFIFYCLILFIHFKLSRRLLKDDFLALVSVILFGSMTNSYLYIRHVLPYDPSLLVLYFVVYLAIVYTEENSLTNKRSFILGVTAFLGYLIYPGYYPLIMVCGGLILCNNVAGNNFIKKFFYSGYFALGIITCLILTEGVSRIGHTSYLHDSHEALKASVTQTDFEESYSFIIKYLFEVEGVTGIIIMAGLALFYFTIIRQFINKALTKPYTVILLGMGLTAYFIVYASLGYFLHSAAFSGRLLHQFFPFVCIFCVFGINSLIKPVRYNEVIFVVLSLAFIINFGVNITELKSIAYPKDIGWQLIRTYDPVEIRWVFEYEATHPEVIWRVPNSTELDIREDYCIIPNERMYKTRLGDYTNDTSSYPSCGILVTNCGFFYPFNDSTKYHPFTPGNNYKLLEEKSHFVNFKAYQFEGSDMTERNYYDKWNFKIKIFALKD